MSLYRPGIPPARHLLVVLMIILPPAASGQTQAEPPRIEGFRFERAIVPGGPGPNRLSLDAAMLAHGSPFQVYQFGAGSRDGAEGTAEYVAQGGLADVRIYDEAGREVPYLLVAPSVGEPRWIRGTLAAIAPTKSASGFEVDLGRAASLDGLRVEGLRAPFLKRVRLEGSGDRTRWTMLVDEGTLFDLPAEKLKLTELDFNSGEYRYLRLTWDDRTSGRLPMPPSTSVRLVGRRPSAPSLLVDVPFERRGSEPGTSRYRLRLPGARLPIVGIQIACGDGDVLRGARVEEAQFAGAEVVPFPLGSGTLRRALRGGVTADDLRIPIRVPSEAQLELVVADQDNPPLSLTRVTAVFARLPWIYFENPGAAKLTARFGHAALKPPQYDLEARREAVTETPAAEARWGELRSWRVEAEMTSPFPAMGAGIDVGMFRYSRPLPPSPPGLTAVPLDAAVLAHSKLTDIRIAGVDGCQVPYLLEKLGEPLSLDLPALERTDAPDTGKAGTGAPSQSVSYYRLRLPYAGLPGARIVLRTSARVFQRRVGILIEQDPYDARSRPWTRSVASALWKHADPETAAPPVVLTIPGLKSAEALVVVEEGDNSPLPLERPRLLLPAHRIRFFREGDGPLRILYGNPEIQAPRYDLALLAPRLVGAAASEIAPAAEEGPRPDTAAQVPRKVFWTALVLVIIVLLALIARLLRGPPSPSE